jgi:hypothetical protein
MGVKRCKFLHVIDEDCVVSMGKLMEKEVESREGNNKVGRILYFLPDYCHFACGLGSKFAAEAGERRCCCV